MYMFYIDTSFEISQGERMEKLAKLTVGTYDKSVCPDSCNRFLVKNFKFQRPTSYIVAVMPTC